MATKQLVQQYFNPFVVLYFWRLWIKMKDARMKNSSLLDSESSLFNASLHLPVKQQSLPILARPEENLNFDFYHKWGIF